MQSSYAIMVVFFIMNVACHACSHHGSAQRSGPQSPLPNESTLPSESNPAGAREELPVQNETEVPAIPRETDSSLATNPTVPMEMDPNVFGVPTTLFDPSGKAMHAFHASLKRENVAVKKSRILFYGASHTAADIMTQTVRSVLQARFGSGGHGLIQLVPPWNGYKHDEARVEGSRTGWSIERFHYLDPVHSTGRFGVMGFAASGHARGKYGKVTPSVSSDALVIFYEPDQGGGSFDLLVDGRPFSRIKVSDDPLAMQPGIHKIALPLAVHDFEVRLVGDGPVKFYGVSLEANAGGVVLDTLGINGSRASSHLYNDPNLMEHQWRFLSPDLMVFAYGTNEAGDDDHPIADYEDKLRRVVAQSKAEGLLASCLLIGPSDRPIRSGRRGHYEYTDRPRTALVIASQKKIAAEMGCGFFDLVGAAGGPMSSLKWAETDPAYVQADRIHFTAMGYRRLGVLLSEALLQGL